MALMYYLTTAGDDAMFGKNGQANFPLEYRRLLGLIHSQGHIEVLRGRLRRFPDRLIDEWLRELQDLRMIESFEAPTLEDITFSGLRPPLPRLPEEDQQRIARASAAAGSTLLRSGSFIADERVANLPHLAKAPRDTSVLLVEDDPDQAILAELRLSLAGYRVRTTHCAKALSRTLREDERPDLLLLDVMLPDGNGFDILAHLRASPDFATLPIVLLTSKTDAADIKKGLALGADGYITKPYSKEQLAEVIGRVLKHPIRAAA
jgi:two-component system, OmpR family, phosphate regulon response regulator PhoB